MTHRVDRLGFVRLFAALAAFVLGALWSTADARAASAIETTYRSPGPWAVSTGAASSGGGTYTLFYPTNLGAGGVDHPILTWGNGTGGTPSNYDDVLEHLASWGFVVIASNSGSTGLGTEILAGASYLVAANANPSSPFFQKLDTGSVGALGHSQGAGGTLNATLDSAGTITSALTIALPNPTWWSTPVPDMTRWPSSTPIFFVRGSRDWLIASESAAQAWYDAVPGPAAKATQNRAGHNEVQSASTRLKGYVTAWFLYTLSGDPYARDAFAGANPELETNSAWLDQETKGLP